MRIPLFASRGAIEPLLATVAERQQAVLEGGRYILGPEVEAFESEFAAAVGSGECVGLASGTEALQIGLRALGVEPGDEVVCPAISFIATAEAIAAIGAVPVFCDVDPESWVMTAETAERAIGPRTAALLPVHLFGNPAPMGPLVKLARSRDLAVLEDAAQATGSALKGSPVGSLGDAAAFSFFPSKNLPAFGDGGALTTDHRDVASRARKLRRHGSDDRGNYTEVGYNSRLDEIQAAGLRVLLPHIEEWAAARRRVRNAYVETGLGDLVRIQAETSVAAPAWHLLAVASPERERIRQRLDAAGIEARVYYTTPLHRQPALQRWARPEPLPETERLSAELLTLPMGADLDPEQVPPIVSAVREAIAG